MLPLNDKILNAFSVDVEDYFQVSAFEHLIDRSAWPSHQVRVTQSTRCVLDLLDVILNLPKLKTHRKVGVTGAIKNIVGLNGSKAYLPHHCVGGSAMRGDCYRGLAPLKRVAEFFIDRANRNIGAGFYCYWIRATHACLSIHRRLARDTEMEGGWSGNDTSWRMVLDLNRLLLYGRPDGSLSETPLRTVFSLTDAIVAGERFGPLAPEPIRLVLCQVIILG